jgi:Tol biopolymer transport system component
MALSPGTRLGPYEIEAVLGAGGMGEVYKARDARLDRTVAIKVLAPEIASDPAFKARFEREARSISALRHPNICVLYDIGVHEGVDYLVLEHLEGETLADRLQREPRGLKLADVLRIGIGIADALDAAHRHGFVHRDLKPGNVMLTTVGPKLLDFGLAKPGGSSSAALSTLATQPGTGTAQGMIVGTLQYMAPEQLEGKPADARTDVFALGAVLFEMMTGRKAFEAQTQASLIAKILETDPPELSRFIPVAPPALERLVQRCLAKSPDDRWQTARDVLLELRWIQEDRHKRAPAAAEGAPLRRWLPWALTATAVLIAVSAPWALRPAGSQMTQPFGRFDVALPRNLALLPPGAGAPALSPDSRHLVVAGTVEGRQQLLVRRLDSTTFAALPGSEGGRVPFWSPDGRSIAFFAAGKLRRMTASGGSVTPICDVPEIPVSGSWGNGVILFGMRGLIYRVAESGGTPVPATSPDSARGEAHAFPYFLPDGRSFLLTVDGGERQGIHLGSLDSSTTMPLVAGVREGVFVAPGSLFFLRGQSVVAVPFDPQRLTVTGPEKTVADQSLPGLSASSGATVVFRPAGATMTQPQWFARDGRRLESAGSPAPYQQLALSPSGKRLALQRGEISPTGMDAVHVWIMEFSTRIASRLTNEPGFEVDPAWSPDERSIAFIGHQGSWKIRKKDLFTGAEEVLADSPYFPRLDDWTPDGRFVIVRDWRATRAIPLSGDRTPRLIVDTPWAQEDQSQVSPDGRWIAFNSDESARWEVYVARFPDFTEKRPISNDGGVQPLWRGDGRELFYLNPRGQLMAVAVKMDPATEFGVPRALFDTTLNPSAHLGEYGVTPDGQRFIALEPVGVLPPALAFVLNWRLDPAAK